MSDEMEDNVNKNEIKKTSSQSSFASQGMDDSLAVESSLPSRLTPEGGGIDSGQTLYDSIAFLIYCSVHKKCALSKANRAVWLPFVVNSPSKTLKLSSEEGISIVLSRGHKELDAILEAKPSVKLNISARLTRVQLPNDKFITQLIQIVKLESNNKFKCCQNTKRIQWLPKNDVLNGNIEKIWGPEVIQMAKLLNNKIELLFQEFSLEKAFDFVTDSKDNSEELLKSLKIDKNLLEKLYVNFLEHCFPSLYMTLNSFKEYMKTYYGFDRNDTQLIPMFNAFTQKDNQFLTFQEFLLGLAAIQRNAIHTDFRIGFIFRYYDIDGDQNLSEEETVVMLRDISPKEDESILKEKAKEIISNICGQNKKMSRQNFSKAIISGELKGTEKLCRTSKSLFIEKKKSEQRKEKSLNIKRSKSKTKGKGICVNCRTQILEYSLHTVKFDANGRYCEPRRIFEPDVITANEMTRQRFSIEYMFNSRSIAQVFLDLIREYTRRKTKSKGFLSDEKELLLKYLTNLCEDINSMFDYEERVIKINSPAIIIGDIRAKLQDLLTMESTLWQSFPVISANFLFLGNYIEFGNNGIECIIYLLSMKLIRPNKVFLLRGSHEIKAFQEKHQFLKECLNKYGEDLGKQIWKLLNKVFEKMPISAIIDESIFCANGGIPRNDVIDKIVEIGELDSDKYSKVVNQILNNEPLSSDSEVEEMDKGFARNRSRGENAFWFDESAVNKFLENNEFTHIIRSNNIYNSSGYALHFKNKCLTIFSNSNFKDNNDLSTVLVDNDMIRIMTIETTNNESNVKSNSN